MVLMKDHILEAHAQAAYAVHVTQACCAPRPHFIALCRMEYTHTEHLRDLVPCLHAGSDYIVCVSTKGQGVTGQGVTGQGNDRAGHHRAGQGMTWQCTLSGSSTLALEDSRRAMHASRPSRSPSSLPLAAMCKGVCPSCTQYYQLSPKPKRILTAPNEPIWVVHVKPRFA